LSIAASLPEPVQTIVSSEQTQAAPEAFGAIDETGDLLADALFADVGGTPLTITEAGQVDGGGIIAAIPFIILCVAVAVLVKSSSTSGGR
jgi:hypothetical protein